MAALHSALHSLSASHPSGSLCSAARGVFPPSPCGTAEKLHHEEAGGRRLPVSCFQVPCCVKSARCSTRHTRTLANSLLLSLCVKFILVIWLHSVQIGRKKFVFILFYPSTIHTVADALAFDRFRCCTNQTSPIWGPGCSAKLIISVGYFHPGLCSKEETVDGLFPLNQASGLLKGGKNGVTRCSRCCHIPSHEIDSFLSVCLRVSTQVAIPPARAAASQFYICYVCVVLEILISCFICRLTSAPLINKQKKKYKSTPLPDCCVSLSQPEGSALTGIRWLANAEGEERRRARRRASDRGDFSSTGRI